VEALRIRVAELEEIGGESARVCAAREETIGTLQEQEAVLKHEWGEVNGMLCERKEELEKELAAARMQLAELLPTEAGAASKEGGGKGPASWWGTPAKRG
jgi:hypothetical protein